MAEKLNQTNIDQATKGSESDPPLLSGWGPLVSQKIGLYVRLCQSSSIHNLTHGCMTKKIENDIKKFITSNKFNHKQCLEF